MAPPRIYVSIVGQDDNLGDSLLRRGLVDAVRPTGAVVYAHVGDNSADYIEAAGIRADDVRFVSARAWQRAFVRSALAGRRPQMVLNAGEALVEQHHTFMGWRLWSAVAIARILGGRCVLTGIGVRKPSGPRPRWLRWRLRWLNVVSWRDRQSRDYVGIGIVNPDWAFSPSVTSQGSSAVMRDLLAVSMRFDRPDPSDEWIDAVRSLATRLDARPVVVAQVRRDSERARAIAERLGQGASHDEWGHSSHLEREAELRRVYQRSVAVVSDRLHALILGACEGAVPVGLVVGSAEKVVRTLEPVGLDGLSGSFESMRPLDLDAVVEGVRDAQRDVERLVGDAGSHLRALSLRIRVARP